MIEQGSDWEIHSKTRSHKRLQKAKQRLPVYIDNASYNEGLLKYSMQFF